MNLYLYFYYRQADPFNPLHIINLHRCLPRAPWRIRHQFAGVSISDKSSRCHIFNSLRFCTRTTFQNWTLPSFLPSKIQMANCWGVTSGRDCMNGKSGEWGKGELISQLPAVNYTYTALCKTTSSSSSNTGLQLPPQVRSFSPPLRGHPLNPNSSPRALFHPPLTPPLHPRHHWTNKRNHTSHQPNLGSM